MSEHHPITDLMLAEKNATGHSIFGPSSAHRWMRCPRSLIAGHLAGDRPTIFAAEGSVAHWLAEDWLNNGNPYRHLGTIQIKDGFAIEITQEMISYVEEYVDLVTSLDGNHYTEVKVNLSQYTPVPSFGTSDRITVQWMWVDLGDGLMVRRGRLIVTDLKYGKVWVDAEDNEQGQAYALGAFLELDWLYDFYEIEIRIAQPRRDNYDSWTISREKLLEFGERYREASYKAWDPNAPYHPDPVACEYCPARVDCPALAAVNARIVKAKFDDFDDEDLEMTPDQAVAVLDREMISADPVSLPDFHQVPIEQLAKIYPWRPIVEKYFREMYDYLLSRLELDVDVPGQKLGKGRQGNRAWANEEAARKFLKARNIAELDMYEQKFISPPKAVQLLRLSTGGTAKAQDANIAHLVTQSPGKPTMISASDKREAIPSAASAFDEDVEAIGNS